MATTRLIDDVPPVAAGAGSRLFALLVHVVDGSVGEFGEELVGVSAKQPGVAVVRSTANDAADPDW